VVDSRGADDGWAVRRRRECASCGRRFTTYERLDEARLVVVKRSGAREPFDRAKLAAGIGRACANRPIDEPTLGAVVAALEQLAWEQGGEDAGAITSEWLGLAVLEHLRDLDDVAYLRYASVYKGFEDLGDFTREVRAVGRLRKDSAPKRPTPSDT